MNHSSTSLISKGPKGPSELFQRFNLRYPKVRSSRSRRETNLIQYEIKYAANIACTILTLWLKLPGMGSQLINENLSKNKLTKSQDKLNNSKRKPVYFGVRSRHYPSVSDWPPLRDAAEWLQCENSTWAFPERTRCPIVAPSAMRLVRPHPLVRRGYLHVETTAYSVDTHVIGHRWCEDFFYRRDWGGFLPPWDVDGHSWIDRPTARRRWNHLDC